jgi:hypothetical protein
MSMIALQRSCIDWAYATCSKLEIQVCYGDDAVRIATSARSTVGEAAKMAAEKLGVQMVTPTFNGYTPETSLVCLAAGDTVSLLDNWQADHDRHDSLPG